MPTGVKLAVGGVYRGYQEGAEETNEQGLTGGYNKLESQEILVDRDAESQVLFRKELSSPSIGG